VQITPKKLSVEISQQFVYEDKSIPIDSNSVEKYLCCDWQIYEQIFFHIMANAIKYSNPDQTIVVSMKLVVKSEYISDSD